MSSVNYMRISIPFPTEQLNDEILFSNKIKVFYDKMKSMCSNVVIVVVNIRNVV